MLQFCSLKTWPLYQNRHRTSISWHSLGIIISPCFSISKWLMRKKGCKELCVGLQNKSCPRLAAPPARFGAVPLCLSTCLVQQVCAPLTSSPMGDPKGEERPWNCIAALQLISFCQKNTSLNRYLRWFPFWPLVLTPQCPRKSYNRASPFRSYKYWGCT